MHKARSIPLLFLLVCALCRAPAAHAEAATTHPAPDAVGEVAAPLLFVQNLDSSIASDLAAICRQPLGLQLDAALARATAPSLQQDPAQHRLCDTARLRSDVSPSSSAGGALPPKASEPAQYAVGDSRQFFSYMYSESHQSPLDSAGYFSATVIAVGKHCTIWLSESHTLAAEDAARLALQLDAGLASLIDIFGGWSSFDVDRDGRAAFVLYPFSDAQTGGFCSTGDLYPTHDIRLGHTGNGMDMLNINASLAAEATASAEGWTQLLKIMFHEWMHLICFEHTGGNEDAWLSEVVAQSGASLAGCDATAFGTELATLADWYEAYCFTPPFVYQGSFLPSHPALDGAAYGSWYLFGQYLLAQTQASGNNVFQLLLDTGACTAESLMAVLSRLALAGSDLPQDLPSLISNFNLALLLRRPSAPYSLGRAGAALSRLAPIASRADGTVQDSLLQLLQHGLPGGGCCTWIATQGTVLGIGAPATDQENWRTNLRFGLWDTAVADSTTPAQGQQPAPARVATPAPMPTPAEGSLDGAGIALGCAAIAVAGVLVAAWLRRFLPQK